MLCEEVATCETMSKVSTEVFAKRGTLCLILILSSVDKRYVSLPTRAITLIIWLICFSIRGKYDPVSGDSRNLYPEVDCDLIALSLWHVVSIPFHITQPLNTIFVKHVSHMAYASISPAGYQEILSLLKVTRPSPTLKIVNTLAPLSILCDKKTLSQTVP